MTIKDKKGVENVVADHLSRLDFNHSFDSLAIKDNFSDAHLFVVTNMPWYTHIVNYLLTGEILSDWTTQDKCKFMVEVRNFY